MTQPLVILGGGFAGFWAAIAARRLSDTLPIQLVSRAPVLQMRPRLYEAAPETLGLDLLPLLALADIQFVPGEATALQPGTLHLASGAPLPFARLVVATGSVLRRPPIPGAETAFSIDTQEDAIAFDRRLAALAHAPTPPRLLVLGAGFTGLELALELRDRLAAHASPHADAAEILLADRAPVPGQELGYNPRPAIEAALREARIQLHLGTAIATLTPTGATLADGTHLPADAVILTTGMQAAPFAAHIPGPRDSLGRIQVDPFLRAPALPTLFVTGDAAAADTGDGHIALQSCQHALRMGRAAGANAASDLLGLPLEPYRQLRYVTCLDLGRFGAVRTAGWNRDVIEAGPAAKTLKRTINTQIIYPPANATRAELLAQAE
jgi:NADH dehydrogenase